MVGAHRAKQVLVSSAGDRDPTGNLECVAPARFRTVPSIAHRLARVEAGAQGEHKLARGYMPVTTYSAHYIADPGLRRAIADYLQRERAYVDAAGEELSTLSPFRKDMVSDEP